VGDAGTGSSEDRALSAGFLRRAAPDFAAEIFHKIFEANSTSSSSLLNLLVERVSLDSPLLRTGRALAVAAKGSKSKLKPGAEGNGRPVKRRRAADETAPEESQRTASVKEADALKEAASLSCQTPGFVLASAGA
ncbi:unnamed protein product, partial [Polarella glacialis]